MSLDTCCRHTLTCRWVQLPADMDSQALLCRSTAHPGNLKAGQCNTTRSTPAFLVQGMHADKRPLELLLQVIPKHTNDRDNGQERVMIVAKVVKPLRGQRNMLAALIAAEASSLGMSGWGGGVVDGLGGPGDMVHLASNSNGGGGGRLSGTGALTDIPALALDKVRANAADLLDLSGRSAMHITHRSGAAASTLATARMVDVDLDEEAGSPQRADAHAAFESTGVGGAGIGRQLHLQDADANDEATGARKAREWLESGHGIKQVRDVLRMCSTWCRF